MNRSLTNSYVVFRLAGEEYALPVSKVSSIIRYEEATPVPKAPMGVIGVINLRGQVIPVVDLQKRFRGTAFVRTGSSRIVVAEGSVGPVGIAVDSANEVTEFEPDSIRPVPEGVLSPETARAFAGVVERADTLTIVLDLDEAVPQGQFGLATSVAREGEHDAR